MHFWIDTGSFTATEVGIVDVEDVLIETGWHFYWKKREHWASLEILD